MVHRRETLISLVVSTALFLCVACDKTDGGDAEVSRQERTPGPGQVAVYDGPKQPGDSEWVLRSVGGRGAAEGSDVNLLFPVRGELSVEGGCMGFALYHELEDDKLRPVEPGLRVGGLECDEPEAVRRQAEDVLGIVRDLGKLKITRERLELADASGKNVAVFVRPAPARVDPALVGTEWFLESLGGHDLLRGTEITLEIGSEDVGGLSGCNHYGGAIDEMDGGTLSWSRGPGGGFASTQMLCPRSEVMRQAAAYQRAVFDARSHNLDGDRLRLGEGEKTLVFRKETYWRSDPAELAGTRWVLRSTDGEAPPEGSVPTVEFGSEKRVRWYDGCQDFSGTYTATENALTVPESGVVGGDCMKPEAFGDGRGPYVVACFGPEGDYRLRDGLLEIRSETGATMSILEPLAEGEAPDRGGTPWVLRGFVEGGRTTPVRGGSITLAFDRGTLRDEGTVFGSAGCNDFRVAYEHPVARNGPDRLRLAAPVVTRRACVGPPDVVEQEQRFLGVLRDVGYYPGISASGRMTLETEDGRKLVFSAPE